MGAARLLDVRVVARPAGVVLVLHGGAARAGRPDVSAAQLSVLRMVPVARRIAAAGGGRLAVHRLLNSARGWDATATPVDDVRWALGLLRQRYDDVPVALVGHSLGGRAALLAGAADRVRSVVALNPWLYPDDHVDLSGRSVLVVHGTDDRVASIERARTVVRNLRRHTEVALVEVPGGNHSMLRGRRAFEEAAADHVIATLLSGGPA